MRSVYMILLKQAFKVTWSNKFLWFFGLFAALLGNGGAYNLGFNNFYRVENQGVFLDDLKNYLADFKITLAGWAELVAGFDFWTALLLLLIIALLVFIFWLSIVAEGALVYGIKAASRESKEKKTLFSNSLRKGQEKFWSVLLLQVILGVALTAVVVILNLPFFILFMTTAMSAFWQGVMIFIGFLVLVPLAIIVSFVVRYAVIYIVAQDKHPGEALGAAWILFRNNWIMALEMGLILFFINLLAGIALLVLLLLAALPFVILILLANYVQASGFLWFVLTVGLLMLMIIMFLFGAVLKVFETAAWIGLFEQLSGLGARSKLERFVFWMSGGEKKQLAKNEEKKQ